MFLPSPVILLMFVAGAAATLFGARKLGLALMIPAILRWLVFPILLPRLDVTAVVPLLLLAPLVLLFVAVKVLQGGVSAIFGPRTAGHVAAVYLVRIFDGLGAAAWWLMSTPVRMLVRWVRFGRWRN